MLECEGRFEENTVVHEGTRYEEALEGGGGESEVSFELCVINAESRSGTIALTKDPADSVTECAKRARACSVSPFCSAKKP